MIKSKQGFIKLLRLRRSEDFRRVFRQGNKLRQSYIVAYSQLNGLGYARLGLAITKKIVPNATSRNRLKRIIRESFRLNQQSLPDLDIVVVVVSRSFSNNQLLLCDLNKQWSSLVVYYKRA